MRGKLETMTKSSFNGSIVILDNIQAVDITLTHNVFSVPNVNKIPLLKLGTKSLYIPQELTPVRTLIKNMVTLSLTEDPSLTGKGIMMSVLTAEQLEEFESDGFQAFSAGGEAPHINKAISQIEPHLTHNFVLFWVEDYRTAETINKMF